MAASRHICRLPVRKGCGVFRTAWSSAFHDVFWKPVLGLTAVEPCRQMVKAETSWKVSFGCLRQML